MQPKCVKSNLESTQVQVPVWHCGIVVWIGLGEEGRGTCASSLVENVLSQLKHEVGRRFTGHVRNRWHCASLAFIPAT